MQELRELLEIASSVAVEAGAALRAQRNSWSVVEAEEGREVKIAADKRAEALILERLAREAPFPVISEEAGWVGARGDRFVWAVDPLDGSVNYLRGYPHCAVSIALLRDETPVLGAVNCFLLDELFTGADANGAWLNGRAIQVSEIDDPARGILQTGVPARADAASFAQFEARLRTWRKVRMIGSAATALAYVAAGRAEAYRESGAMIWDVAGGCALVRAAGGRAEYSGPALDGPLEVVAHTACIPAPH